MFSFFSKRQRNNRQIRIRNLIKNPKNPKGSENNCNADIYFNTIRNVSNHVLLKFDNCRHYNDIGLRINFHVTLRVTEKGFNLFNVFLFQYVTAADTTDNDLYNYR